MSREHQGKKYDPIKREAVLGVYLGCLNYNLTSRLTGLAPNSVKNIVREEKKKDPKKFAKLCTKNYKRANKYLEDLLWETQRAVFDSASLKYMDYPYRLNQFMHTQDKQLIQRSKLLYDAKRSAIAYEVKRIERALMLRDLTLLTKHLKEAEKDTKDYEPLDLEFLSTKAFFGASNEYSLSDEERRDYIKQIEDYLIKEGYNLDNTSLAPFLTPPGKATHYYYESDWRL